MRWQTIVLWILIPLNSIDVISAKAMLDQPLAIKFSSSVAVTCPEDLKKCTDTGGNCVKEGQEDPKCICDAGEYSLKFGCPNNFCKIKCGIDDSVQCEGKKTSLEDTICKCQDTSKEFNEATKMCTDNFCKIKCGIDDSVQCEGKKTSLEDTICKCQDTSKEFNEATKMCTDNFCKIKCGIDDNVQCEGKKTSLKDTICKCQDNSKEFNEATKMCTENFCKEKCGEDENVQCDGQKTSLDNTICNCKKPDAVFNETKKICAADFCKKICGEDENVVCEGDRSKKDSIVCKCKQTEKVFDQTLKICKGICKDDSMCMNGGKCEKMEDGMFCSCLKGTEGSFCEKVPECDDNKCGTETNCLFDVAKGSAICKCKNESLTFDTKDSKCKVIGICKDDSMCRNGGKCVKTKDGMFCSCLKGTEGSFCEKVPECDNKKCGTEANCVFDIVEKIVTCKCEKESLTFDAKDSKCKVNKCKDMCGVASKNELHVLCEGDPYGKDNVSCKCKESNMDFISADKSCKVNKCRVTCGANAGKDDSVKCDGDPFGKKNVSCSCQDKNMVFSQEKKTCKKERGLSNLAVCGIVLAVVAVTALIVVAVLYRKRKNQPIPPTITMRFRQDTVSFENTLYGTNSETHFFQDPRN